MAKPKVLPTPEGREIVLKSRQAKITNVNSKPEQHGKELAPRVDVSIEFIVADVDVDQIINVEGRSSVLWNSKGEPIFRELGEGLIPLDDLKAQGTGSIGPVRGSSEKLETVTLKKVSVLLGLKNEATVHAQLRFDPTGYAELVTRLQCARMCKFSFNGAVLVNAGPDDEDPDGQDKLPL